MPLRLLILLLFTTATGAAFSQDTIYWQPDYELNWNDFKSTPDDNIPFTALSSLQISYSLSCEEDSFEYSVNCIFKKNRSWVKEKTLNLLTHERLHFDIAEIYARKLRKFFKNYKYDQDKVTDDTVEFYEKLMREFALTSRQYDIETDYSGKMSKQDQWRKKIAKELKELEQFCK